MTGEEARRALSLFGPYQQEFFGFWSFVMGPYDESRRSGRAHFWPNEKSTPDVSSQYARFNGSVKRVAMCGITNRNRYTFISEPFYLERTPHCKKCEAKLRGIAIAQP